MRSSLSIGGSGGWTFCFSPHFLYSVPCQHQIVEDHGPGSPLWFVGAGWNCVTFDQSSDSEKSSDWPLPLSTRPPRSSALLSLRSLVHSENAHIHPRAGTACARAELRAVHARSGSDQQSAIGQPFRVESFFAHCFSQLFEGFTFAVSQVWPADPFSGVDDVPEVVNAPNDWRQAIGIVGIAVGFMDQDESVRLPAQRFTDVRNEPSWMVLAILSSSRMVRT